MGWTPEAPAARGQTRDRWESLQALVDHGRRSSPARPARPRRASSPTSTAGPPSSTPRSPTASPWPRSTPPRAWSGTRSSWPACRTARCRSPTPTTPAEVEEERRLLYVGMTRARVAPHALLGAGPQPGRPRPPASPPGSSTGCCPTRRARPSRTPRARRASVAQLPRVRQAARRPRAEKKRGRCDDCPASYDEELFERLRAWRKERADEESVPAFVVFTDATLQLIAEQQARRPRRPCCASAASARPSSSATATTLLELVVGVGRARSRSGNFLEKYPLNRLPLTTGAR